VAVAFRGRGGGGVLVRWAGEFCWTSLQLGVEEAEVEGVGAELPTARWSGQRGACPLGR
jgi:hypothetical protein